jgi:hypothetical protein
MQGQQHRATTHGCQSCLAPLASLPLVHTSQLPSRNLSACILTGGIMRALVRWLRMSTPSTAT